MMRLQTEQRINNQRIVNPLSHSFKYHPSHNTTQLESGTECVISPTQRGLLCVLWARCMYSDGYVSDPGWGSSQVCLPYTPSLIHSWPQRCSKAQWDDRCAEEFLYSVPKPTCQDFLLRPGMFLCYYPALLKCDLQIPNPALSNSPNTAHLCADAPG